MSKFLGITRIMSIHIAMAILTLIGITLLSFVLGQIAPGDLAYSIAGQDPSDNPTEEEIAAIRAELGLDRPIAVQYINWVKDLFSGKLGISFMSNKNITTELKLRIPVTIHLSLMAMLFLIIFSLPLGFMQAVYKDSWFDKLFLFLSSIFSAIPSFLLGIFFIVIFAQILHWLPTSGYNGLKSLILPAITISLSSIMMTARLLRNDLIENFNEGYFLMSRSKGFPYLFSAFKHALPNALVTLFSVWSNYLLAILGGSTIAENVFALPGLGQWILRSINSHDYPAVQAYVLIMGILCVFVYLATDLLLISVQPKLRKSI